MGLELAILFMSQFCLGHNSLYTSQMCLELAILFMSQFYLSITISLYITNVFRTCNSVYVTILFIHHNSLYTSQMGLELAILFVSQFYLSITILFIHHKCV